MKKTLLSLLLMWLWMPHLPAQDSNFIVREGSEWLLKYKNENGYVLSNYILDSSFFKYEISGDTLLDGEPWKKIWRSNVHLGKPSQYYQAIKEKEGKVWINRGNATYLLYDFNLKEGDTITSYMDDVSQAYFYLVGGIDTVTYADQIPRKRIPILLVSTYQEFDTTYLWTGEYDTWVEGIGSLRFGLYPYFYFGGYCFPCPGELYCYQVGGDQVYERFDGACQPSKPAPLYEFAPKGAKWIYNYMDIDRSVDPPRRYRGYQVFRYEKDSLIEYFNAKVLTRERVYVDIQYPMDTIREQLSERYLMQNGGRIFMLGPRNEFFTTWTLLINFNLGQGSIKRATAPSLVLGKWPGDFYTSIMSVQDTLLANRWLKKIEATVACEDSDSSYPINFIERMGSTSFLFYNEYICHSESASTEINNWQLRCYSDDEISIHFSEQPCNLITSTRSVPALATPVKLFPNPVGELLQIESELPVRFVQVYNSMGQKVIGQSVEQGQLSTAQLLPGIYFVQGYDREQRLLFRRKVVKR